MYGSFPVVFVKLARVNVFGFHDLKSGVYLMESAANTKHLFL